MKPVAVLHQLAQKKLGAEVTLPSDVQNARKYYEGIIACAECNGVRSLVYVGLKKGSAYHQSWEAGWKDAEAALMRKQITYLSTNSEHRFLKAVGT